MKTYQSIEHTVSHDIPVVVFDKLDGSNIRAEWNRKQKKFYKFGSRNVLLDENSNNELCPAISLIREKYEQDLNKIFLKQSFEEAVCFFEFFGPNSFAGYHQPDDLKTVVLFDINVHKQGILYPTEFVKLTKGLEIPTIIHQGKFGVDLQKQVAEGTLEGMTFEGVVCKSISPVKKGYPPWMFKYKSQNWLTKLKQFANGDEALENRLK
jgi:hypothetical protein